MAKSAITCSLLVDLVMMYVPFSFFQMLSYLIILDFISSMAFHILSTVSAVW